MPQDKINILVVNNFSRFASKDVWEGMIAAFKNQMGLNVLPYGVHMIQAFFSPDMIQHHITSTAVSTRNSFTHVLFVGSTFLDDWVIKSIKQCGVKVIYWSLEDPHALDQNSKFIELSDYYFSNERAVPKKIPGTYYLPTGGSDKVCMPPRCSLKDLTAEEQDVFNNDIVFCGNVYPNRRKLLEDIIPDLEKHHIKLGVMGVTSLMEDDGKSPIRNYIRGGYDGVVDHHIFIMAYGFSKFVINIERDPHYEYDPKYSTNRKYGVAGESLNPRAYEVALCGGGLQLIDSSRKEIFEKGILVNGKHCVVYANGADLIEKVLWYTKHENERRKIVKAAREHALLNHTYLSRAKRMVDILNWKEGNKKDVISDAIDKVFSNGKIMAK